jgi:hypothetical protein
MSAQRDFVCQRPTLTQSLSASLVQPCTPKIDHIRLAEPLPELEFSLSDGFATSEDFTLEFAQAKMHEFTTETTDASEKIVTGTAARSTVSDLSGAISRPLDFSQRLRFSSEHFKHPAPNNSVFKFLLEHSQKRHPNYSPL